jgi:ABC-type transport system involved in multi-copper enzyme maturation permease subunit
MKFLAILKDSLREAVDTKVFYVTLGLSAFLILLVASVSFRPITVEDQANQIARSLGFFRQFARGGQIPELKIDHFEHTGPDSEPWKGKFRFDLVLHFVEKLGGNGGGGARGAFNKEQLHGMLKGTFYRFKKVEMDEPETIDPQTISYAVRIEDSKIDQARDWEYEPSILFAIPLPFFPTSLSGAVYWIEDRIVNRIGAWIGILAGVVITAFFIPNMLRKGTIDLLLAKPVRRWTLLLFKYVGGLSFVFLNAAFVVGGIWLVLGLRSGIWAPDFLLSIFVITFFFAILYSVSTLFSVLTRSPIVAILMTVLVWAVLFFIGLVHQFVDPILQAEKNRDISVATSEPITGKWWVLTIQGAHFVLPRTNDLDVLTTNLLSHSLLSEAERKKRELDRTPSLTWGESLTVSGIFVAVLLGLSCWRFTVKDY